MCWELQKKYARICGCCCMLPAVLLVDYSKFCILSLRLPYTENPIILAEQNWVTLEDMSYARKSGCLDFVSFEKT